MLVFYITIDYFYIIIISILHDSRLRSYNQSVESHAGRTKDQPCLEKPWLNVVGASSLIPKSIGYS